MKYSLKKQLIIPLLLLSFSNLALASGLFVGVSTLDDVVRAINNVWNLIASSVTASVDAQSKLLYEANPSLPAAKIGNTKLQIAQDNAEALQTNKGLEQLQQALTQKLVIPRGKNEVDLMTYLANVPASNSYIKEDLRAKFTGAPNNAPDKLLAQNANLAFNTLIAPSAYTRSQELQAMNFIRYSANLAEPITSIRWWKLTDEQKEKLQTSEAAYPYLVMVRNLAAADSVAIDNLLNIYAERVPVENLGKETGMKKRDASPSEVSKFLAERRSNDPKWYEEMSKASPATLAREQLFVMVEMQRQLLQLHEDNQRIMASLAMLQLQSSTLKRGLLKIEEDNIKQNVLKIETNTSNKNLGRQLEKELPSFDNQGQ